MDTPAPGNDVQVAPRVGEVPNGLRLYAARPRTLRSSSVPRCSRRRRAFVYYLLRPEPLLLQGEVDATRLDIAARVDGRVKDIPIQRGQNVPAGAVLMPDR